MSVQNSNRGHRGQVMVEYLVALAVVCAGLFVPVDLIVPLPKDAPESTQAPLFVQVAYAIRDTYMSYSAAISVPITPI